MVGLHADDATANRNRPIPSRIARNNSLGTATSAIWKTIFREWRTTFAPILINFSRNVVNVQWRLVCRDSASLIFTLVNDNVLISFTIPMNGTPERRERSGWGEHVDDSRNLGPHSL